MSAKIKSVIYNLTDEELALLKSNDDKFIEQLNNSIMTPHYKYLKYESLSPEEKKNINSYALIRARNTYNENGALVRIIFGYDETSASDFSQRFSIEGENSKWNFTYYPGSTYGPPEDCYPDEWDFEVEYGGLNIKYGDSNVIWLAEKEENVEPEPLEDDEDYYDYTPFHRSHREQKLIGYGKEEEYIEELKYALNILNKYFKSIEDVGYYIVDKNETDSPSNYKSFSEFIGSIAEESNYALEWNEDHKLLPSYKIFCDLERNN